MYNLNYHELGETLTSLEEKVSKLKPPPVMFFPYLKRCLEADRRAEDMTYPRTIKIPKANKYLLQGDFEPEYEIHLEKPVETQDGIPMWLNACDDQVWLRFGYKDRDVRFLSDERLSMEYIHSFLGGASGHGKSVTLNALLCSMCYEYAPWELEVHLSDAKIVEFKKYGMGNRIPHIASIAATEDADFVISVLQRAKNEMQERGKIFGSIGASNLKKFNEKTGLRLPRVLILMDEVESTFRLAGKQAQTIANLIDDFARLGRAAGYHVFMSTQNVTSDIPKSAFAQVRNRYCLGAADNVSQAVLANGGATTNYGIIGRLIANTQVMNGGDTRAFNVEYQTPFVKDEEMPGIMSFLEQRGKEVGFRRNMAFYDEEDMRTYTTFDKTIDASFERMRSHGELTNKSPLILGMPAFVSDDADSLLKINLEQKDIENVVICSAATDRAFMHLHNISKSLNENGYVVQLFTSDVDNAHLVYNPAVNVEARAADKAPLATVGSLVRKRTFLMQLDKMAGNASFDRRKCEEVFEECGIPRAHWGNERLCQRFVVYNSLIGGGVDEWADVAYLFPTFLEVYQEFEKCNCLIKQIEASDFRRAAFIIGDLAKIQGYGRDNKSKYITALKKAMQDACRVNVVFVLYTRSMDGLTDLVSAIRYAIFDVPDPKDWGRLRTEEPRSLNSRLALLFDNLNNDNPQRKFKRTLLKPEF